MSYIFKFILNVILFVPRLILDSITSLFKLLLLLVIIVGAVLYLGKYSVKSFFSPSEKVVVEPSKDK